MKSALCPLLLLCVVAATAYGQQKPAPALYIGDPAPALQIRHWLKGDPIRTFEKGQVYVIDFWATWCKPCIASMPYVSAVARKYKDRVTIIEVDIRERGKSIGRISNFVDSMGHAMDFHVAVQDSNYMDVHWIGAFEAGSNGIPVSFIVNQAGKVAWIGYPLGIDSILPKVLNNTWDIPQAAARRKFNKKLKIRDIEINKKLNEIASKANDGTHNAAGQLACIAETVNKEPALQYAPMIAYHTFYSLLVTDQQKAYAFGKKLIMTTTYTSAAYGDVIHAIEWQSDKQQLTEDIYQLGAEAYQQQIDHYFFPRLIQNLPDQYHKMAAWYWRAGNRSKAIEAEQKAIETSSDYPDFSKEQLGAFKQALVKYQS